MLICRTRQTRRNPGVKEVFIIPFRQVYIYFALLVPVAILAFWKKYFAVLADPPDTVTPLLHVHALAMFLWVFMLVAQAWFIRTFRFRLHRLMGRSSYVIAPLIVLLTLLLIHEVLNRFPDGVPHERARNNVFGFGMVLAYATTWCLAIAYRRHMGLHVRFIISTVFAMATAIVFRVFLHWVPGFRSNDAATAGAWATISLLLFILIAADWRNGIRRSPYWVVTIFVTAMNVGYWTFTKTDGWLAFCQWYGALPLRGS
jgi:hypothetical protein